MSVAEGPADFDGGRTGVLEVVPPTGRREYLFVSEANGFRVGEDMFVLDWTSPLHLIASGGEEVREDDVRVQCIDRARACSM